MRSPALAPSSIFGPSIVGLSIVAPAALALAAMAAPALADVPQPLPADCAQGSIPQSSRQSAWCEPTACESDAECPAYEYCATERSPCPSPERYRCSEEPLGLCVVSGAGPAAVTSGACRSDADCPTAGARCERARRCVHGPERSGLSAIGCGCRASGSGGRAPARMVLAWLFGLGIRRARRSRS